MRLKPTYAAKTTRETKDKVATTTTDTVIINATGSSKTKKYSLDESEFANN